MKKCKKCNKDFDPKTNRAIFCSDSCRVGFHQMNNRKKTVKMKKATKQALKSIPRPVFHISKTWLYFSVILGFVLILIVKSPQIKKEWLKTSLDSEYRAFHADTLKGWNELHKEEKYLKGVLDDLKIMFDDMTVILRKNPKTKEKIRKKMKYVKF